jgi:hypothetical protein
MRARYEVQRTVAMALVVDVNGRTQTGSCSVPNYIYNRAYGSGSTTLPSVTDPSPISMFHHNGSHIHHLRALRWYGSGPASQSHALSGGD